MAEKTTEELFAEVRRASQAFIDAFGGDCPNWLQGEYDDLLEALARSAEVTEFAYEWVSSHVPPENRRDRAKGETHNG